MQGKHFCISPALSTISARGNGTEIRFLTTSLLLWLLFTSGPAEVKTPYVGDSAFAHHHEIGAGRGILRSVSKQTSFEKLYLGGFYFCWHSLVTGERHGNLRLPSREAEVGLFRVVSECGKSEICL